MVQHGSRCLRDCYPMRSYKSMLVPLVLIALIGGASRGIFLPTATSLTAVFANTTQSDKSTVHTEPQIDIHLSALKRSYLEKRPVMVRVEIRNIGRERIFVPSEIGRGFSDLEFWWESSRRMMDKGYAELPIGRDRRTRILQN